MCRIYQTFIGILAVAFLVAFPSLGNAQTFSRFEYRELEGKYAIWELTMTFDEHNQHKFKKEKRISGFIYDHIEMLDYGNRGNHNYWVYQQGDKKGIIIRVTPPLTKEH